VKRQQGYGTIFLPSEYKPFVKEEALKIVVCVKLVPDSAAKLVAVNGRASWGDAQMVINPWDEFAVEAALRQQEALGGSVTVISMGGENARDALKHALAMGCEEAVLISPPTPEGADTQVTSQMLAAAIRKINTQEPVLLALFGRQAIDDEMGLTAAQTARRLGWPSLTLVSAIQSLDQATLKIRVDRSIEEGRQTVETTLPAVLSVMKDIGEPRYPSFLGIRKASRAVIPTWSLADLGITAPIPVVEVSEVMNPPVREVSCELITGDSPREIAVKLVDKILAEKVL